MRNLLVILAVCHALSAGAQDSAAEYYTKKWMTTTIADSVAYFRVGEKNAAGKWNGRTRDYYKSGRLASEGTYVQGEKTGTFASYHENGQLSQKGEYHEGNRSGGWKTFHENGQIESEGVYVSGKQSGTWKYYYDNGQLERFGAYDEKGRQTGTWKKYYANNVLQEEMQYTFDEKEGLQTRMITFSDSLGQVLVEQGNGRYWFYDHRLQFTEEGRYANGVKTGEWKGTSKNSPAGYLEWYDKNGRLEKGTSTDREGNTYTYTVLQQAAEFPGGGTALYRFLAAEIRYPADARDASLMGRVYVEFVIDTDGSVINVKIKKGVYPSLDTEAVRVVKAMPKWNSATNRGKPVKMRYVIPINFKLS